MKPIIKKRAKENQGVRTDICQKSDKSYNFANIPQNSVESNKPIDTKRELAKVAGVSHDTIHKVEAIEKKAPIETKRKLASSNKSKY